MTKYRKRFSRLINIAGLIKGFFGAIGGSAIVMDHKWIGLSILAVGALADQIIIFLKKEQDDEKITSATNNNTVS